MKKTELIFRFYDPNVAEDTANFFFRTMLKANEKRIEEWMLHTMQEQKKKEEFYEKRRCVLSCVHG